MSALETLIGGGYVVVFEQSRARAGVAQTILPSSRDLEGDPPGELLRRVLDNLRTATVEAHGVDLMPRPDSAYYLAQHVETVPMIRIGRDTMTAESWYPQLHPAPVPAEGRDPLATVEIRELRPVGYLVGEPLEALPETGARLILVYGDGRPLSQWARRRIVRAHRAGRPVKLRPLQVAKANTR